VGPTVGLDGCGKSRPPLWFEPGTFRPVTFRKPLPRITNYENKLQRRMLHITEIYHTVVNVGVESQIDIKNITIGTNRIICVCFTVLHIAVCL